MCRNTINNKSSVVQNFHGSLVFFAECRENCCGFVKLQYIFERAIEISRENFRVLSKIRKSFVLRRIYCLRYSFKKLLILFWKIVIGGLLSLSNVFVCVCVYVFVVCVCMLCLLTMQRHNIKVINDLYTDYIINNTLVLQYNTGTIYPKFTCSTPGRS